MRLVGKHKTTHSIISANVNTICWWRVKQNEFDKYFSAVLLKKY
jgi:hypothetical protein